MYGVTTVSGSGVGVVDAVVYVSLMVNVVPLRVVLFTYPVGMEARFTFHEEYGERLSHDALHELESESSAVWLTVSFPIS